jgi:exopolyphosphatase/pppGpp-phosphohydrolase
MGNAARLHRDRKTLHSVRVITLIEISEAAKTLLQELKKREIDLLDSILKEGIQTKEFVKHNSTELAAELLNISRALEYRIYHSSRAEFLHEIDFSGIDKTMTLIVNLIVNGLRCTGE